MRATSVTDFRANIATMLDRVVSDNAPLIITRGRKDNVVVVSERDWEGMQETLYLLSSPANARELLASIAELREGRGAAHELTDPDSP